MFLTGKPEQSWDGLMARVTRRVGRMKVLWVDTNFMHPTTKGGQIRTWRCCAAAPLARNTLRRHREPRTAGGRTRP